MSVFFAELRRRKVVRVAVVYAATAFAVLQAADMMLPRLGVPEWAMSLIVVLVVLGFPVAIVLAWALELTPDGMRVTPGKWEADSADPPPALVGRRTTMIAALLVVLGIGLGTGWFLRPTAAPGASEVQTIAPAPLVVRSIAVLPFVNMSADRENEYFSDGISEELLNLLAKVPGLQVAARTSSFAFKDQAGDLTEIGRQLRVSHVLEGSVRKVGERVRITAQLIEAREGYHLWSDSYDRELLDVFAVQDEIAAAIVGALEVQLGFGSGAILPRTDVTIDARAHDLYLLGLRDWYRRGDASLRSALERFQEAARLDPAYAPAHAGMALTYAVLPMWGDFPVDEAVRGGKASARRALELNPGMPEAHAALGQIAQNWEWEWAAAEQSYDRALALNPNYATAHMWRCELFNILARREEAFEACRRGLALDPLAPVAHNQYAAVHAWAGQPDSALASYARAIEFDPDLSMWKGNIAVTLLLARDFDGWLRYQLETSSSAEEARQMEALHAGLSRPADAEARAGAIAVVDAVRREGGDFMGASILYLLLGETERALVALTEAVEVPHLRPNLPFLNQGGLFDDIAEDPRYRAVLRAMNLEK